MQAVQFVQSAKELFDLLFRLREAKKRVRERKDQEEAAATDTVPDPQARERLSVENAVLWTLPCISFLHDLYAARVVAGVEAPPDYHVAVTDFQMQNEEVSE